MPTSELSDALNPYYAQPRSRPGQQRQAPFLHSAIPQHTSHRSELELAISEPSRAPSTPPTAPISHGSARPTNPQSGGVHAVQELLRFLASTREAQEIEHRRRIAWEQEQEAKYKLRQAEMERRMLEMQQEIAALKARVVFSRPTRSPLLAGASVNGHCNPVVSQHLQLEYSSSQQPSPSTSPTLSHPSTPLAFSSPASGQRLVKLSTGPAPDSTEGSRSSPSLPATRFINVNPSSVLRNVRETSTAGSDSEEELEVDDDSLAVQCRVRRRNHHDTRCLTIQHAMRHHMLRAMMLDTDKDLPDSHTEGTPLGLDEPVRFVWEKTPRQSVHNGRMKERVLKELRVNRKSYKHVPDKDFGKKMLDSVFDQAFVTFRQKFRAQRDDSAAQTHKRREELKAQRARRLSRRKVKLGNRSEARNRMRVFEHVTFDGALQLECMSSEESESESEAGTGTRTTIFRIRGIAWRSARLQRFYDALDEEERVENEHRPRRGVGRRERCGGGTPKEGVVIPPKGVASWMVSKGWMREMASTHGEEVVGLLDYADDQPRRTGVCDALGEESA